MSYVAMSSLKPFYIVQLLFDYIFTYYFHNWIISLIY